MIIGIGTDIINKDRIEESINKFGDSFINKCFTDFEISESSQKKDKISFFSKRFAAKEAFYKAIGTGFTNGVSWKDVEVHNDEKGKPNLYIKGKSKEILLSLVDNPILHLTLSDDKPFAMATVIIEKEK